MKVLAYQCLKGLGIDTGSSVRLLRLVSAHLVWGIQKNSKWSLPSTCSSNCSTRSSKRCAPSTARKRNAGTTRRVTRLTMPSAPTPTRAAWNNDG
ncbi:unannotated protein [freshwater metagenome]|uniref:Unannotated protein n=1 Tax=freshwater metagenome TaxID=449393 RepID=A0A6J6FW44_9ZZZZ